MALFSCLTLVVAIIAAVFALHQLRAHHAAEKARNRPYVIVDFSFSSILVRIEIKNIGTSPASNVQLRVDPAFESGESLQAKTLNSVFSDANEIPMLAPNRRILYSLDRGPDYHQSLRPKRYTVTAKYSDLPIPKSMARKASPKKSKVSEYEDTYILDFHQWSKTTLESDYANMNWNIAKRQEKVFKDIASSLKKVSESMSNARRDQGESAAREQDCDVARQSEMASDYALDRPLNPQS